MYPGLRILRLPWVDTVHGLDRCLGRGADHGANHGARSLALVFLGLAVSWWVYVPLHELLHAAGCAATGGTVTELQIAPVYGGALLARLFPWVTAGGDYAGRLSGFDTGDSDFIYLATVLAPYLLTVFPGVWALRWAGRRGHAALFGVSLPVALAPFVSLPGDAYEIGSIVTTRLPPWTAQAELLRGDDVIRIGREVAAAGGGALGWTGLTLAFLLGVLWALATYGLGAALAGSPTGSEAGSEGESAADSDASSAATSKARSS